MNKIRTAFVCVGILWTLNSYCQNIPMGTLPMLYNGGFAGESQHGRLNGGIGISSYPYRISSTTSSQSTDYASCYFASYDQFITKLSLGVGLTFSHDYNRYSYNSELYFKKREYILLSVSPKLSFKGKYTLAPFLDVAYINTRGDVGNAYRFIPMDDSWSVRTGFLFNSKKFYAGFSYYIFNTDHRTAMYPYYATVGVEGSSYVIQAGYTFQRRPESNFSFTPQVAYLHFNGASGIDLNFMFRYKKFIWSINNNGLGLGMQHKNFRFMVSQSYIFFSKQAWSGSLSLRYVLK